MPPKVGTTDQLRALMREAQGRAPAGRSPNKFNAERVMTEHVAADSRHEARWVETLMTLQQGGYIGDVEVDKRALMYALDVNGVRIAQYEADARFTVLQDFPMETLDGRRLLRAGTSQVLDAKSKPTRAKTAYVMKRNLMFALFKIKILEV